MTIGATTIDDRVRENTSVEDNLDFDQDVKSRMERYRNLSKNQISRRLERIEKEWNIERALEVNVSTLAIAGVLLGAFSSRKWYFLTFIAGSFLLQHGVQGWCPPLPLLRKLGFRTRAEIDEEINALKTLRGDFDNISSTSSPGEILSTFRK